MSKPLAEIEECNSIDFDRFHQEILPGNKPVILRCLVDAWPAVEKGRSGSRAMVDYLKSFDNESAVYTIVGNPEINGRFFYSDDLAGVNFQRVQSSFTSVVDQILALANNPRPHAIAIQAASVRETLPGFAENNHLALLDNSVSPTMWLGNQAVVAPHYDVYDNIACVVAGTRKFTLFPPDQIENLYVGPTLGAPGGVPISLVDLRAPDLEKFPRFAQALDVATQATLKPGDAIFIPSPWWHAVESLQDFNVLVNYWWGGMSPEIAASQLSPSQSLMHSMLTIAGMTEAQRQSWRAYFDYFVFRTSGDPAAHLPSSVNDLATSLTPAQRQAVYKFLKDKLE